MYDDNSVYISYYKRLQFGLEKNVAASIRYILRKRAKKLKDMFILKIETG